VDMQEASKLIGKTVSYVPKTQGENALKFKVKIISWRSSYGKNRFLVEPIAGTGRIWTEHIEIPK